MVNLLLLVVCSSAFNIYYKTKRVREKIIPFVDPNTSVIYTKMYNNNNNYNTHFGLYMNLLLFDCFDNCGFVVAHLFSIYSLFYYTLYIN